MRYPFVYVCQTKGCNSTKNSFIEIKDMPLFCGKCREKTQNKLLALTAQKIIIDDEKRKKNNQKALTYYQRKIGL